MLFQTWVKSSGGSLQDENFYGSTVRSLLTTSDSSQYENLLADLTSRWSPAFVEYYQGDLQSAVLASADFAIRQSGVESVPYVGITNNVSESYNRVLKDFQNWKVCDN